MCLERDCGRIREKIEVVVLGGKERMLDDLQARTDVEVPR